MSDLGEEMRITGLRKENIRAWGEVGRLKAELEDAATALEAAQRENEAMRNAIEYALDNLLTDEGGSRRRLVLATYRPNEQVPSEKQEA